MPRPAPARLQPIRLWPAIVCFVVGVGLLASLLQTWLGTSSLATQFLSPDSWRQLATTGFLGGRMSADGATAELSYVSCLLLSLASCIAAGAVAIFMLRRHGWGAAFRQAALICGATAIALDLWEWVWLATALLPWQAPMLLLGVLPPFWAAAAIGGGLTAVFAAAQPEKPTTDPARSQRRAVWGLVATYAVVFVTMNWRLYFNLLIPHGDSAMYEEHLWNLLHGKGFRSYLDQGLFWGEHIQFVHLFLLPLYALWPSHLLLELCESCALAAGAWPVYWLARRHTGDSRAAVCLAASYLLYFPTQFLDIEIDIKTFRPEAFGLPLLLLTLDQLDRKQWRGFLVGLLLTLTVKEDYSLVFGPLGLWIAWQGWSQTEIDNPTTARRWQWSGLALSAASVAYLFLATRVVMPWFRSGAEVHYARYFSKFGETPEQIVRTMLTQPGLLFGELISIPTLLYALSLLVPVAGIALLSPSRLLVGLPLFGILCLNELAKDPRHQFHAPLVAIVFWAAAAGLPRVPGILNGLSRRLGRELPTERSAAFVRHAVWTFSLATGLFFSLSPLGVAFWDPGSSWSWQRLYAPQERAAKFAPVAAEIPRTARVASTDFVHPRFTHYARSYDYSGYARKVSNYEQRVPDDTDYIVIDTRHRYSTIHRPEDIPEYRDHPDQWELLPDQTDGYFIMLRRRR